MRCSIIRINESKQTGTVQQEYECDVPYISIGRGPDQTVELNDLRVALHHARISKTEKGKLKAEAKTIIGIRVNGKLLKNAIVEPGDCIEISQYRITLTEPTPGHDVDLQLVVETIPSQELEQTSAYGLAKSVAQLGISIRSYSWLFFVSILLLFLALPLAQYYLEPESHWLDKLPIPKDTAWSTGALASAHSSMSQQCDSCHQTPFQKVQAESCLHCHNQLPQHFTNSASNESSGADYMAQRHFDFNDCSLCHAEHQGAQGLQHVPKQTCLSCHKNMPPPGELDTGIGPIANFHQDHPQFKVRMKKFVKNIDEAILFKVALDDPYLEEKSNLIFPHDIHLSKEGLRSPQGKTTMQCVDCHQTEPGGGKMETIRFADHCQSCHQLYFEPGVLRQLPHADVEAVRYTLQDFYANEALMGNISNEPSLSQLRRRRLLNQAATEVDINQANNWARKKQQTVSREIFENRLCVTCHKIIKSDEDFWQIQPVVTTNHWFANSKFNHDDHQTESCESCHSAERSRLSADVLIPDISNCRSCHSDDGEDEKVETPCYACHQFHQSSSLYDQVVDRGG